MLRLYTRVVAVALAVAGAAAMSDVLKTTHGAAVLYLFTAAIFAYIGFWQRDEAVVRSLVGGMGVLYLLYGLLLAAAFLAWGSPLEGRGFLQSLANAAFGGLNMLVARALSSEDQREREESRE